MGTDCKDDHALLYAGIIDGVEMVLESIPSRGVCLTPLSHYDGIDIAWNKHEDFTDEEGIAVIAFGMTHLHDHYSYRAIILNAFRILHITDERFLFDWMKNGDDYICSEFVVICYRSIGRMTEGYAWLWTPATLTYRILYQ